METVDEILVGEIQPIPSPRPPRSKRGRLSLACTQCRKRKVRCDASIPKCRNCVLRGDPCETFDPRHPTGPAVRRWPSKDGSGAMTGVESVHRRRHSVTVSEPSSTSSLSAQPEQPHLFTHATTDLRQPSWVERAYHENQTPQDLGANSQSDDSPDIIMRTDDHSGRVKVNDPNHTQYFPD